MIDPPADAGRPVPASSPDFRQGCECQCCDHGEGSDCACDCHATGRCAHEGVPGEDEPGRLKAGPVRVYRLTFRLA